MKQLILLLLIAAFIAGCSGLMDTPAERDRRIRNIVAYDSHRIVDDLDHFWLADRPSYLSYWSLREAD